MECLNTTPPRTHNPLQTQPTPCPPRPAPPHHASQPRGNERLLRTTSSQSSLVLLANPGDRQYKLNLHALDKHRTVSVIGTSHTVTSHFVTLRRAMPCNFMECHAKCEKCGEHDV